MPWQGKTSDGRSQLTLPVDTAAWVGRVPRLLASASGFNGKFVRNTSGGWEDELALAVPAAGARMCFPGVSHQRSCRLTY